MRTENSFPDRGSSREAVAIAIPTFRRPDTLATLLDHITKLSVPAGCDLRVVVADNDPDESARAIVRSREASYPLSLTYVSDSRDGISGARNACLRAAPDAELLAFIDDDELPSAHWLEALLHASWRSNYAAIVTGPVLPRFSDVAPKWYVEGGFFDRPRRPSGTKVRAFGGGNCMLPLVVRQAVGDFAPAFGTTGAEDTEYAFRARKLGVPIVWADDAICFELVPDTRLNESYLLKRSRWAAAGTQRARLAVFGWPAVLLRLPHELALFLLAVLELTVANQRRDLQARLRARMGVQRFVGNLIALVGSEIKRFSS